MQIEQQSVEPPGFQPYAFKITIETELEQLIWNNIWALDVTIPEKIIADLSCRSDYQTAKDQRAIAETIQLMMQGIKKVRHFA